MLFSSIRQGFAILCFASSAVARPSALKLNASDAETFVKSTQKLYENKTLEYLQKHGTSKCSAENIAIRRAWDDLPNSERADYIRAVHCMHSKPTRTSLLAAPGARNRADDFVYQHINQTNFIHLSGLLLPWHRQFLWAWEQDLRNECGYSGYLPYWPWERYTNETAYPVFQPGAYSFGTNGIYIPDRPIEVHAPVGIPPGYNTSSITPIRKPGTGGGCITDGPFANITVTLGPSNATGNSTDQQYGLAYNPRCITRDFEATNLSYSVIADLWTQSSIHTFHPLLEKGAHVGGHLYMGGDGSDVYSSPNEPVFFLHHGQIDRLWTVWQGLDLKHRKDGIDGTLTFGNIPPSENATLDSIMHMGIPAGGDLPISYAQNAVGGDYCYMYV